MKKFAMLGLMLVSVLTFGLIIGCQSTSGPSQQQPNQVASIELRATHTLISGYQGEQRSEQLTAIARDAQGVALPGVVINFSIQNPQTWKGTIAKLATDTLSDQNGEVHATYTVVIERTTPVVITAVSNSVSVTITINVNNSPAAIGRVIIEPSTSVLSVPPAKSGTKQFTATLVDTAGNALPGMQLRFRTSPASMGIIDSDTGTTDQSGTVTRNFTSVVNKYGICNIYAQVGDSVGMATIEIRQTAAPAFVNITSTTKTLQVAEGVNATLDITATVTDMNRVGVPNTTVEFQVHPFAEGLPTFGALTNRDTTDADGYVTTTFNTLAKYGKLYVHVQVVPANQDESVEAVADSILLEVKKLSTNIDSLNVRAIPAVLDLPPDSLGQSLIRAQVRDASKNGIPNVPVSFTTTIGTLSDITVTDTNGVATAKFITNFETGFANITASIAGTGKEASCTIEVKQSSNLTGRLNLTGSTDFIYADNGLTKDTLTAVLKDQNNTALVGKQIFFSTAFNARLTGSAMTDSAGTAQAVFADVGIPSLDEQGNPVPVWIYARYGALNLIDSVACTIRPRNPVASIALTANKLTAQAGSADSITLQATCFLLSGGFAPVGITVTFEMNPQNGVFTQASVPIGAYGVATTQYVAGQFTGNLILHAKVANEGGGADSVVMSNDVQITLLPGPPSGIRLIANPTNLNTNDPGAFATITAFVTDTAGNAVTQGTLVRFTTTKGNVLPTALTDTLGRAVSRLTAGVESGVAEITGTVNTPTGSISGTCTVTFIAGYPNVIELGADPLLIAVQGSGINSSSTLAATVKDANGNTVELPAMVVFQLLNNPPEPLGSNINNHGSVDSARTANGVAVATLNAGQQIGGVLVRAFTWRDPDSSHAGIDGIPRTDTVSVILSNVAVVSGPPFALDIDVNDAGSDAGGGTWKIPVSARVYDLHLNPVADRIPVVFTVNPDNIATIDPGYTGNDIGAGATAGLAYSRLYYNSRMTFDTITVRAEVQAQAGQITGERPHRLPLQTGSLRLQVDPQNWMWDRSTPDHVARDTCLVRVWAILTDGHQIRINGGSILFRTDRGHLYWKDQVGPRYQIFRQDQVARRYTGLVDAHNSDTTGVATVYLIGHMNDFYLDDFTLEVTVHIEAGVEGYDVAADPAFVFMTRH